MDRYLSLLVQQYLQESGIYRSGKEVALVLESHPAYPSVWAISQTLAHFGVENDAFSADYAGLQKITGKSVLYLNTEGGSFVLLRKVADDSVHYYDVGRRKNVRLKRDDFLKQWQGVVLTGIPDPAPAKLKHRQPVHLISLLSVFLLSTLSGNLFYTHNIYYPIFLLLNITGALLSVSILYQSMGYHHSVIDRVCYSSKHFDCKKVTESPLPYFLKNISLADVSFVFFLSGTLLFALIPFLQAKSGLYFFSQCITMGGIPVILLSLGYQQFAVKKWCPLCLLIATVLGIQIIVYLIHWQKYLPGGSLMTPVYILLLAVLVSYGSLRVIKGYLKQKQEAEKKSIDNLRLKRLPGVMTVLFHSEPYTELNGELLSFGSEEAPVCVTTLLSPYCKYCGEAVLSMLELIRQYPDVVRWRLFFDGVVSDKFEKINEVQLYLASLYDKDIDKQKAILESWYTHSSVKHIKQKYSLGRVDKNVIGRLKEHVGELQKHSIGQVPFILINNIKLPNEYSLLEIPLLFQEKEMFARILSNHPQQKRRS